MSIFFFNFIYTGTQKSRSRIEKTCPFHNVTNFHGQDYDQIQENCGFFSHIGDLIFFIRNEIIRVVRSKVFHIYLIVLLILAFIWLIVMYIYDHNPKIQRKVEDLFDYYFLPVDFEEDFLSQHSCHSAESMANNSNELGSIQYIENSNSPHHHHQRDAR